MANNFSPIQPTQSIEHMQKANTALVILGPEPTFDQQLAATSLYLFLKKLGKKASLLGVKAIKNPTISGLQDLKTDVGYKNLVINFDYIETAVHNVSYHIDEEQNKFYLTIKPQPGHEPLDKDAVETEYVGADSDLIVLFGVDNLESLEQLYHGYEDLYQNAAILTVNNTRPNYQSFYLNSGEYSSQCELVFQLAAGLEVEIDPEAATNLFAGIQYETNNFIDPKASADTFEAIAQLLRSGARRKPGSFSFKKKPESAASSEDSDEAKKEVHKITKTPQAINAAEPLYENTDVKAAANKKNNFEQKNKLMRPSGLKR